jgi:hypothetical protein
MSLVKEGTDTEKSNQAMFSGSPPTPRSAIEHEEAQIRTRSSRMVPSSSSLIEEEKAEPKTIPRAKKAKAAKGEKPKTPKLTAPLSILTKDATHIPVKNMEEWVNRSVETRRKEVEKRNGYVTRPMNSFMLYRSAYAERTKQWCTQNNHQVVSSVSGESWPLEPPEIRDLYNEYAKIERINHQNAHPTYKFSPSKTVIPPRKRKGEFSDDEPSDLEDSEWNPGQSGRSRHRHPKRPDRAMTHQDGMNTDFFGSHFGPDGHELSKSSWEMTNEGRVMPMHVAQGDLYNHYFQTSMHPNMNMAGIEDLRLRRVDTPLSTVQFSPEHAVLGLPGGNIDLMEQLRSHSGTPIGEAQVDPMLLAFDGGQHHDMGATVQHPEFQGGHMGMMDRDLDQHSVDSFLAAGHGQEAFHAGSWQPDPNVGQVEQESEFEKWMGDQ